MKREQLSEMTKDELREHAQVQGVSLEALDTKGTMIDKILGEHVAVANPKKSPGKEARMPALGRLSTLDGKIVDAPRYRVTIFSTENDNSDVDLIVNGHNIRVQRNKEVILQEPYVELLRNAVVETVVQDPDTGVRAPSRRMVYPHQAVPV